MERNIPLGSNGYLPVTLGKSVRYVFGGPYRNRPHNFFGVKMAVEIKADCDVNIPTHDFSVPPIQHMRDGLVSVLVPLVMNEPIYVGCMGGIGRTGLFLAVLAKALGVNRPVNYVREHYLPHAVETEEQRTYVSMFDVRFIHGKLPWCRRAAWVVDTFPSLKGLTKKLILLYLQKQ